MTVVELSFLIVSLEISKNGTGRSHIKRGLLRCIQVMIQKLAGRASLELKVRLWKGLLGCIQVMIQIGTYCY